MCAIKYPTPRAPPSVGAPSELMSDVVESGEGKSLKGGRAQRCGRGGAPGAQTLYGSPIRH